MKNWYSKGMSDVISGEERSSLSLARNVAFKYQEIVKESGKPQIDSNPKLRAVALELLESNLLKRKKNRDDKTTHELVNYTVDAAEESRIDEVTGLPNRRAFNEGLLAQYARFKRSEDKNGYTVIMMDIDNFKMINDRYGHDLGDTVLVELAKLFKLMVRKGDIVARWGGDEFAMILPDGENGKLSNIDLADRLQQVNEKINEYMTAHGYNWPGVMIDGVNTHLSLGLCHVGQGEDCNPEECMVIADNNARLEKQKRKIER